MIQEISTNMAPKAIGPYSQATIANGFVFCSGQLGLSPETGELIASDIALQTKQVLENLSAVLKASGSDLSKVVRCDVFVKNMANFQTVNEIYKQYFKTTPYPARQTVEVSNLPKNALVEISCIALTN
jgi:2-iminobutanoate/2-iminopropanoate deaminase